jgi:hypothetical protein
VVLNALVFFGLQFLDADHLLFRYREDLMRRLREEFLTERFREGYLVDYPLEPRVDAGGWGPRPLTRAELIDVGPGCVYGNLPNCFTCY